MDKKRIKKLKREYTELFTRIDNLDAFIKTNVFKKLSYREKDMLLCQIHAMRAYCIILGDRISFYEGKPMIFEWRCE